MLKKIRKIQTKILLPSLLILFTALLITGGFSAYFNYKSTIKTLDQTMTGNITAASNRVKAELGSYKALLTEIGGILEAADESDVVGLLEETKSRNNFSNISITGLEGRVENTKEDVSGYEYFKVPRDQGAAYVSEPVMNADQLSMTIYVSAPIKKDGKFNGIVFAGIDAKKLSEIVSESSIGKTGTAAMIDKNGSTIAYNDYSAVLAAYNTNEKQKMDPKLQRLAALERKLMAGESGFGAYSYDGKSKFMAYAPVEDTNGWGMYVTVAQSEILSGAYAGIGLSIFVTVVFLVLASLVLMLTARSISRPIVEAKQAALEMAKGNYEVSVTYESRDEIGSLSDSMREMISTTKSVILDTERGLGEISKGNFDIAPKAEYIGIYHGIQNAMIGIITDLSGTMSKIRDVSGQVTYGSELVAHSAQALAQGAAEQASSVEELSASMNEISNQVTNTAANAEMAHVTAAEVGSNVQKSNEQMMKMIEAMAEISASSFEIGKIIKTIEDIAFQTNILALNAAVEAARAGSAGKGFAVVADEVRNLANKSSEAAKQTNKFIEDSVKCVENGVRIVDQTAQSLSEVVLGEELITNLILEISKACTEQSDSILQINQGVEQISGAVQTNTATSEQSAAASRELNEQAIVMKGLVEKFKLGSF